MDFMERRQWNLKWTADNAILCLLSATIFIPVFWGYIFLAVLLFQGKPEGDFPIDRWLMWSSTNLSAYAVWLVWHKKRHDRKAEMENIRESTRIACQERRERWARAEAEKNADHEGH